MVTAGIAFLIATVVSSVVTPLVRSFAHKHSLYDNAAGSSRKIHTKAIPRLGGIGIVVGFFVPVFGLIVCHSSVGALFYANPKRALGVLGGGLAIALLGLYDDLYNASPRAKFAIQFLVAGVMCGLGYRVDHVVTPFGGTIGLGLLAVPVTMLWIVGVTNAMNLIDGLDGLAGGAAMIATITIFVLSSVHDFALMMLLSAALGGAVLGFLFYNFNPATIFMGDSGSLFLGFMLACGSLRAGQHASSAISMAVPIVLLGLPIGDTLLAVVRRAIRRKPLFGADRGHIHHLLLDRGLTQRQAVGVLYGVCASLAAASIMLNAVHGPMAMTVLACLAMAAAVLLQRTGYFQMLRGEAPRVFQATDDLMLRRALQRATVEIDGAGSVDEVWLGARKAATEFGARSLTVSMTTDVAGEPTSRIYHWNAGPDTGPVERLQLGGNDDGVAALELSWYADQPDLKQCKQMAEQMWSHASQTILRLHAGADVTARVVQDARDVNVFLLRRRRMSGTFDT
jgi:UDP-GlcNAc:undecaprenyl-phosphate GlcNAc-1-phosphate transferase